MSNTGSGTGPGVAARSKITDSRNAKGKHIHHGQTPAAWVGSLTAMVAVIVAGLALVMQNWPLFWIGIALLAAGAIAGLVLQKMGHGAF